MSRSKASFSRGGAWFLAAAMVGAWALPTLAANSGQGRAVPQAKAKPGAAEAMALASHRAVYELTLVKSVGNKSPTAAHGQIAFDFAGSPCEGYVQNFRQFTELQPAEGPTRISDMHSATFEDPEGKNYDFKMQTKIDNSAAEAVDGKAFKSAGGALSVQLAKPKPSRFDLAAGVLFPTEHLRQILATALAGKNLLEVKVYDGSETGEKVFETTTVIGRAIVAPAAERAAQVPALANLRRWPVSIAYFEAEQKDNAPSYTLSFDLYENGISRALKLDYGDFVLGGEMSSLELVAESACLE